MKLAIARLTYVAAGLAVPALLLAQAPAGATAACKDGTYSTATSAQGRCSGHGGVDHLITAKKPATHATKPKTRTTAKPRTATPTAPRTETAATAATAPAGATARCGDGTYSSAKTTRGACSGHDGVRAWLHGAPSESASTSRTTAPRTSARVTAPTTTTAIPTVAAPTGAPAGATAQCKDGTYSTSKVHTGACSHHGGVAQWFK
jgi:hypothetical protein